jgi:uncharacterized protein YecA (UPF0149 family)
MTTVPPFHPVGFGANLMPQGGLTDLRFSGAEGLLGEGAVLIDETGRNSIGGADFLLVVQATRASHTLESVISLCRIGRGVQAAMLNRSLLEDVLDVHWVAANREAAPNRADEHERLIGLGERAQRLRFGHAAEPLSVEEEADLAALLRTYDNFRSSWTLANHGCRRALVEERWGEGTAEMVAFVYEVIQRQNNTLMHGSPSAYRQILATDGEGRTRGVDRLGVDRRWRDSLSHGVLGYYLICKVIAEEFGFDKEPAEETFYKTSCYLKELSPEELDGLGAEDNCPCRSGRTFNECHGS